MLRLHIGCGDVYLKGWVNIDVDSNNEQADLHHDVSQSLPYDDESVELIYSEHFIEHLSVEEGIFFLKESHRVLAKSGILRIATLDLDYLAFKYFFRWKDQDWIKHYGYSYMQTNAEMFNVALRYWGHQWVYNFAELSRRLEESGFTSYQRVSFGKSHYVPLKKLETRKDSKLVIEAVK